VQKWDFPNTNGTVLHAKLLTVCICLMISKWQTLLKGTLLNVDTLSVEHLEPFGCYCSPSGLVILFNLDVTFVSNM
jgi:hypothetical protein